LNRFRGIPVIDYVASVIDSLVLILKPSSVEVLVYDSIFCYKTLDGVHMSRICSCWIWM